MIEGWGIAGKDDTRTVTGGTRMNGDKERLQQDRPREREREGERGRRSERDETGWKERTRKGVVTATTEGEATLPLSTFP